MKEPIAINYKRRNYLNLFDSVFSIYLWVCIRSIHKDLEQCEDDRREEELLSKMVLHKVNFRRRRARSMVDETTLAKTANVNFFELKDVRNMIFDMLKTEDELSQDSLFSPGMMVWSDTKWKKFQTDCILFLVNFSVKFGKFRLP